MPIPADQLDASADEPSIDVLIMRGSDLRLDTITPTVVGAVVRARASDVVEAIDYGGTVIADADNTDPPRILLTDLGRIGKPSNRKINRLTDDLAAETARAEALKAALIDAINAIEECGSDYVQELVAADLARWRSLVITDRLEVGTTGRST